MLKILHKSIITLLLIIAIKSNLSASNDIQIFASFEPSTVALGQRALLNLTIEGAQTTTAPTLPTIDDLNVQYLGTQKSIQFNNNTSSIKINHVFTVTPQKTGNFTLPPFDIEIRGQKHSVLPAKLTVIEKNQNLPNETPPITLETSIEKNQVYIGQMIPVTITLYAPNMPGQFQFGPNIQGNSFIDYAYKEKPETAISIVDGAQKLTMRFKQFIIPLKNNDPILQYKVGLAIQKPRSHNKNRSTGNPFSHSGFSSLIDDIIPSIEEIEIESTPINLSISPLPTIGKPNNFTGAIGQFTLLPLSISSQEAQVGDPLTLKMEIQGTGNLDRITPPLLETENNWKTYPPKSTIHATDAFGYTGSKVFEYIIIPQSDTIIQSPNIAFSFFDPQSEEYTQLIPDPIALKITPTTPSGSNNPTFLPVNAERKTPSEPSKPELLPIKLEISHSQKSLIPLISQHWLIITMLISALSLCICSFLYKKLRLKQKDSAYIKAINTQKAVHSNLQKVAKAYSKQNALAFYDAATIVILEIVARQHPKSAPTLTLHDILEHFSNKSFSEDNIIFIKTLFTTVDLLKFSGFTTTHTLTPEILKKFENLIQKIQNLE